MAWVAGGAIDRALILEIEGTIDATWAFATDGYWTGSLRTGEGHFPGEDELVFSGYHLPQAKTRVILILRIYMCVAA